MAHRQNRPELRAHCAPDSTCDISVPLGRVLHGDVGALNAPFMEVSPALTLAQLAESATMEVAPTPMEATIADTASEPGRALKRQRTEAAAEHELEIEPGPSRLAVCTNGHRECALVVKAAFDSIAHLGFEHEAALRSTLLGGPPATRSLALLCAAYPALYQVCVRRLP